MEASDQVVVEGRRLGRRPPKNAPALRLSAVLTGVTPPHPLAADHFSAVSDWGLYRNDMFGVCGPTSVGNSRKLITKALTGAEQSPTLEDVFDLYRRSGNPGFDPATGADDKGVDMQTMLEALLQDGIGGIKPLCFAKVDHTNLSEMDAAVDIFGFVLLGVSLETAQQAQTDTKLWDWSQSPVWGGHAVLNGRYNESTRRRGAVTWAEVVDFTDQFAEYQLEEAWVVVWPEFWNNPVFDIAIDKTKLASIYQQLTDRAFPVPVPTPQPPVPTPVPGGGASFQLVISGDALVEHIRTAAARGFGGDVSAWATNHFKHYFKL